VAELVIEEVPDRDLLRASRAQIVTLILVHLTELCDGTAFGAYQRQPKAPPAVITIHGPPHCLGS